MRKVYSHLSAEERVRIDELRNRDGLGVRQIVLRIGRDKSTVSREPGRGLWFASNENESYPETAEGGRVDVEAVLFGDDRAAQGRAARANRASPCAWRIRRCSRGSWTRLGRAGRPGRSSAGRRPNGQLTRI